MHSFVGFEKLIAEAYRQLEKEKAKRE